MRHGFLKATLYCKRWDAYWKLSDPNERLVVPALPLGPYPLDLRPRLNDGHYPFFDDRGIPMWPSGREGRLTHHVTTMTSYALARWHEFLATGEEKSAKAIVTTAQHLAARPRRDLGLVLKNEDRENLVSAMNQGEGISVLCRAWVLTRDDKFADAALDCLAPFERSVREGGVVGRLGPRSTPWFEESTVLPLRHILNGMVYAVWGLGDLAACTGDDRARHLFDLGIESLAAEVSSFDLGWWSLYWVPDPPAPPYIASMMYHNLHICQLQALASQTGNDCFSTVAERFLSYARSPFARIRAALALALAKARRDARNPA